jgi:DNA-binding Lrp family transcriptional regulator
VKLSKDKTNEGEFKKMTLVSLPKPYIKATQKRRQIGEDTDEGLLKIIKKNPRLSLYELALEIGWGVGKVDGSVKRLHEKGLIKVECFIKAGRRVKLISAIDHKSSPDTFNVPIAILSQSTSWKDAAYIYGLDRLTIGVSGKPITEWGEAAVLKSQVPLKKAEDNFVFQLPRKIADFYALEKSIVTLSTVKDVVLLTVEGQVC